MKIKCFSCNLEMEIPDIDTSQTFASVLMELSQQINCDECSGRSIKKHNDAEIYIRRSRLSPDFLEWDRNIGNNQLFDWVLENSDKSLFISDANGKGKTRTVSAVAWKTFNRHRWLKFYRSTDFLNEIMSAYAEGYPVLNSFKDSILGLDLLILDDLGKEKVTDRAGEVLFDLLDSFYQDGKKKIWITTNITNSNKFIENLGQDRGSAIVRRIKEKCLQWQNHRRIK